MVILVATPAGHVEGLTLMPVGAPQTTVMFSELLVPQTSVRVKLSVPAVATGVTVYARVIVLAPAFDWLPPVTFSVSPDPFTFAVGRFPPGLRKVPVTLMSPEAPITTDEGEMLRVFGVAVVRPVGVSVDASEQASTLQEYAVVVSLYVFPTSTVAVVSTSTEESPGPPLDSSSSASGLIIPITSG